jgi:putative membrane protein
MLRVIVGLPLLVILVVFALSNTEPVRLGFWPTDFTLQTPLSSAVLTGAAIAFLLGGLLVWVSELGQRRRARRAEENVRVLEERLEELKARLARPLAPPS